MDEKEVWKVLGIEKTADEAVIRDAYRQALLHTNPEDDPEGFKALRVAYERATEIAAHAGDEDTETEKKEETPMEILIGKAGEIYQDIRTRRDLRCWEEWAGDPLIQGLDTVDAVRREFLLFCEMHYQYPTEVWRLFDRIFRICDEAATLVEEFPEDYIRYVIRCIRENDYFTYDALIRRDELDYAPVTEIPVKAEMTYQYEFQISEEDKYIRNVAGLYQLYGSLQSRYTQEEEKTQLLDELAARIISLRESELYHPFEAVGLLRYLDFTDRNEEGLPVALHFLTPESISEMDDFSSSNLAYFIVRTYYKREEKDVNEIEFVIAAFDRVLSHEPHYVLANYGKAIYHFMTGDYVKADEEILLAFEFNDQSQAIEDFADIVDEKLLDYYRKRYEEDPGDIKARIEAGWCYLRKNNTAKTMELLTGIVPDEENEYAYYNLYARCFARDENFKEAEPHLLKWQSYLLPIYEKLQNGSEETLTDTEKQRLDRLSYSYYLLSLCRKEAGDPDGTLAMMDKAIETSLREDERVRYTFAKGQMLHEFERYDAAMELWSGMIGEWPDYGPAYIMRQEAAFNERNARQVIDDFWTIVGHMPEYTKAYIYAAQVFNIYERGDLFDEMMEVANQNDIDSMALSFEQVKRYVQDRNYQDAYEILNRLYPDINEEKCDIEDKAGFYTEYGSVLYYIARDPDKQKERKEILEQALRITEEGIRINNGSRRAHWIKTDILEAMGEDATDEYELMLDIFAEDADVYYEYGRYLERMKKRWKAIELYRNTLKLNPEHRAVHEKLSDYYLDRFLDTEKTKDYRMAVEHAEKQLGNYASSYYYVAAGLVYLEGNEFEKAVQAGAKAAEEDPENVYAYNVSGYALMMLKRFEEAEEAFGKGNEILKKNPENTALQRNYIRFLEMRGRYGEAIEYARAYYEQFHISSTNSHDVLARLYKRNRNYEEAIREYDQVSEIYLTRISQDGPGEAGAGLCRINSLYPDADISIMSYLTANLVKKIETLHIMGQKDAYEKEYADLKAYAEQEEFTVMPKLSRNGKVQRRRNRYIAEILREIGRHELYVRREYGVAAKHMEMAAAFMEASLRARDHSYLMGKIPLELAEIYMRDGRTEEAVEAAKRCMPDLIWPNRTIEDYLRFPNSRPFRYGELAKYFYFIGQREKVKELFGKMTDYPLCNFCHERECYDQPLSMANLQEIDGDREGALENYRRALELNSSDAELYVAIAELTGRGAAE